MLSGILFVGGSMVAVRRKMGAALPLLMMLGACGGDEPSSPGDGGTTIDGATQDVVVATDRASPDATDARQESGPGLGDAGADAGGDRAADAGTESPMDGTADVFSDVPF